MKKAKDFEIQPKTESIKNPTAAAKKILTIVGIGCSAGGLEVLEEFLTHVPDSSCIAFVIIQHLNPNHHVMKPDLLQRSNLMKLPQAHQHLNAKPICLHLTPPNKIFSLPH